MTTLQAMKELAKIHRTNPSIIPTYKVLAMCCILAIAGCSSSSKAPTEEITTPTTQKSPTTNEQSQLSSSPYKKGQINQGQIFNRPENYQTAPLENNTSSALLELERIINAGNYQEAKSFINQIDRNQLSLQDQARLSLAKATIFSAENQHNEALQSLAEIQITLLSKENISRYYWLNARAMFQLGRYQESLESLANRTNYLEQNQLNNNYAMMSNIVNSLTPDQVLQIKQLSNNTNLLYWFSQNPSIHQFDPNTISQYSYSGTNIDNLPPVESIWTANSPKNIAVLLPFNSRFSSVSAQFQKGINQAHAVNLSPYKPQINFYDIGSGDIELKIQLANQNGADFIIGPLGNQASNQALISANTTPIMTIGGSLQAPETNKYTFSLKPEADAVAIAQHARSQGYLKALILAPDSARGNRLATAFENAWVALNGISERQQYTEKEFDHSGTIKLALGIYASENRFQQLADVIGTRPKFIPTRKEQVDMIFLASNFNDAKNLKPQLNYHDAHEVPTYGPSEINLPSIPEGQKVDLDGLIIPEMPALIPQEKEFDGNKETAAINASQSNLAAIQPIVLPDRLEALGYDAYQIIPIIQSLNSQSIRYPGKTGMITINENGDVQRFTTWVKFSDGKLNPID